MWFEKLPTVPSRSGVPFSHASQGKRKKKKKRMRKTLIKWERRDGRSEGKMDGGRSEQWMAADGELKASELAR